MYTADPELCKELYELSGWTHPVVLVERGIPLYDLGYLLRKLPEQTHIWQVGELELARYVAHNAHLSEAIVKYEADTPEDAAAKLAIELWKQGILNKEVNS